MTTKELFTIAVANLREFTSLAKPDFRLEQIEYNKKENVWDIIISFLVPNTNRRIGAVASLSSSFEYTRKYKKLKISNDKKVLGIYIYNNKE